MKFERIYDPITEQSNALAAAADPACTRELMSSFYAEIPLTQGKVALVDDDDLALVEHYTWCLTRRRGKQYVVTNIRDQQGVKRQLFLHHLLLPLAFGFETDHKNGNGLDNRRSNLRRCTRSQNNANARWRVGASGYRGVSWSRAGKRWLAKITVNRKQIYLGLFATPEEAARIYDDAARSHFGEFARTNFPL